MNPELIGFKESVLEFIDGELKLIGQSEDEAPNTSRRLRGLIHDLMEIARANSFSDLIGNRSVDQFCSVNSNEFARFEAGVADEQPDEPDPLDDDRDQNNPVESADWNKIYSDPDYDMDHDHSMDH